ncbi:caspase family protein [Chitinophaga rhizophila]|uniref:Caspase family protein n=1 Tax=Chitinophaga rhizophila TaxID=2866212 RepID=A0ABS7G9K5_9BACT|nr:caspase family protein [Chitinophaga rhizophila]MBW8684352.1 caspase family protein [Chitinophaga rhizophila]
MRKALVVGIDDYPGSARLRGCVNDANAVAELLDKNADGSPNFQVKLFTTAKTKDELKSIILEAFNGHDDDVNLFYFSGHGNFSGTGGYIVTPDFSRHNVGISMDELLKIVGLSRARHKIVVLDCCHAGAMGTPAIMGNSAAFLEQGVIIMASSRSDESAVESNGHGVFTSLLIDALKGGAADVGGEITASSIYSYINRALGSWDQRPVFKANIIRPVSLRKVNPPVLLSELRKLKEYFPDVENDFQLDPSYEYTTDTPNEANIATFKILRRMQLIGLIEPVGEEYMYWAAVRSKSCRLTSLGKYYWKLIKDGKI